MAIALRGLHEELRPYAEFTLQLGRIYGLDPTITSVLRSSAEQSRLYDRFQLCLSQGKFRDGETYGCQYPANPPGSSSHEYGVAWDSWVPDEHMPLWTAIRRAVGWRVPETDLVHAELPGWRDLISVR